MDTDLAAVACFALILGSAVYVVLGRSWYDRFDGARVFRFVVPGLGVLLLAFLLPEAWGTPLWLTWTLLGVTVLLAVLAIIDPWWWGPRWYREQHGPATTRRPEPVRRSRARRDDARTGPSPSDTWEADLLVSLDERMARGPVVLKVVEPGRLVSVVVLLAVLTVLSASAIGFSSGPLGSGTYEWFGWFGLVFFGLVGIPAILWFGLSGYPRIVVDGAEIRNETKEFLLQPRQVRRWPWGEIAEVAWDTGTDDPYGRVTVVDVRGGRTALRGYGGEPRVFAGWLERQREQKSGA